jgi:hypothetical protein
MLFDSQRFTMSIRLRGLHGRSECMLRPPKVQTELARVIIQDGVFHGMGNDQELASKNADQGQNQSDAPEIHISANRNPPRMVINSHTIGLVSVLKPWAQ